MISKNCTAGWAALVMAALCGIACDEGAREEPMRAGGGRGGSAGDSPKAMLPAPTGGRSEPEPSGAAGASGRTGAPRGAGSGGSAPMMEGDPPPTGEIVPLFDDTTELEPEVLFDRGDAVVTRFGDRGRDRHAREDMFQSYDHYLPHYWKHRTARFLFVD